jgi:hypothetical protein
MGDRERIDEVVADLKRIGTPEALMAAKTVLELYKSRDVALYWMLSVAGFRVPAEHMIAHWKREALEEWVLQDGPHESAHDRALAYASKISWSRPPNEPL